MRPLPLPAVQATGPAHASKGRDGPLADRRGPCQVPCFRTMQPVDSRAQVSAERAATWSDGCHRPTGGVCQSADAKDGREATDEAAPGGGRGSIPVPVARSHLCKPVFARAVTGRLRTGAGLAQLGHEKPGIRLGASACECRTIIYCRPGVGLEGRTVAPYAIGGREPCIR